MKILRGATVALEVMHYSPQGVLHGHSLRVEMWTTAETCLDAWRARMASQLAVMERGTLEQTAGRTFEDVAIMALRLLPEAVRAVVRVPTRGIFVEVTR